MTPGVPAFYCLGCLVGKKIKAENTRPKKTSLLAPPHYLRAQYTRSRLRLNSKAPMERRGRKNKDVEHTWK